MNLLVLSLRQINYLPWEEEWKKKKKMKKTE
jgi:hypothetical protein